MKSFLIITFGCKVNTYETEAIKEELIQGGYVVAKSIDKADLVIFNTCSVTRVSEKKCLTKIRSIANNYPNKICACFGCFSQLHPEEIAEIDCVKVIIGNRYKDKFVDYINNYYLNGERTINVKTNLRQSIYENLNIDRFGSEIRAFVKIQDGCDNFCSYCVIPLTRGKSCSRNKQDILDEISRLASNGYREIVLSGVDMGSYENGENYHLAELIEDILKVEPSTFRLRISSLEASQINDKIIAIYKNNHRLVPHLHIPLQSGNEHILELMGRKYDLNSFYDLTIKLKEEISHLALSTDVIVGFPSETDEEFNSTCEFVKKVGFMRVHVFPYSARPFTAAAKMKNQVSRMCAKKRVMILNELGHELGREFKSHYIGQNVQVLIEEELSQINGSRAFRGYSENYIDLTILSKENLLGKLVEVKVCNEDVISEYSII